MGTYRAGLHIIVTALLLWGICGMDCGDRILSEHYFDVITDFPVSLLENNTYDLCYVNIDNFYNIVYINESNIRNANEYIFDYNSVPKLYGLMQEESIARDFDPNSLIVSGITQVQRAPLSLSGRGVVLCVIDTGDGVISLSMDSIRYRKKFCFHL